MVGSSLTGPTVIVNCLVILRLSFGAGELAPLSVTKTSKVTEPFALGFSVKTKLPLALIDGPLANIAAAATALPVAGAML